MALPAGIIHKPQTLRPPNLEDHGAACAAFSWAQARRALEEGLEGQPGFNMATLAVDRHARSPHAAKLALRWLGKAGARRDLSYAELSQLSNRFANVLQQLQVDAGDHVFLLCGRLPELYVALLGALKHQCVVTPLFSAFGPEPIATRLTLGHGRVLVTTSALYRRTVQALREHLPELHNSGWKGATVQQLLDMTADVDYNEVYSDAQSDVVDYAIAAGMGPAPEGFDGARDLYSYLPTVSGTGQHGREFRYRTLHTEVLGWVLRRVTGLPTAELIGQRLWSKRTKPLLHLWSPTRPMQTPRRQLRVLGTAVMRPRKPRPL